MTRRRPRLGVAAIALVAGLVGACGVPDHGPVATVDPRDVPYNLLGEATGGPGGVRNEISEGLAVFFTSDGHLVRLGLDPGAAVGRPAFARVLDALSSGPTPQEQRQGIGTAIPPGLRLVLSRTVSGTADIELAGQAAHPDVEQNALAAGQIVLTATSVPGIDSVRLTRNGQRVDAALPFGDLAARPVTASDYASLVRLSSPPPRTAPPP